MAEPHYTDDQVTLYGGDSLEVLPTLPDNSVDAVVTDPPYGLEFMGKDWDSFKTSGVGNPNMAAKRRMNASEPEKGNPWASERKSYGAVRKVARCLKCGKQKFNHEGSRCHCSEPLWDYGQRESMRAFQAWCELWAAECLRILKPGGHLLAFGGTRTAHRLACAIEDAGFEIRDSIAWLYGSGFPKSLDVSKAIDARAQVNDETRRRIALVAEVIRTHREAKGLERAEVSLAVVGTPSGACWNWENHQLPSVAMWPAIKQVLGIPDKFDGLIEGDRAQFLAAERDVIANGVSGKTYAMGGLRGIETSTGEFDITAPATDAARQWQGWGTALKPAHEPIVVARKPLSGTVAANVLEYGCGAINIDATRIQTDGSSGQGVSREAAAQWCRVHDLRPVREAHGAVDVPSQAGEVADDMRVGVPVGSDARSQQQELDGWGLDSESGRLSNPLGEASAPGGSSADTRPEAAGVFRTPASGRSQAGPPADTGRDGAPPQRDQDRQPVREPASNGLGNPLEGAREDRARSQPVARGERSPASCTCGARSDPVAAGRWPANVCLDEHAAAELDQMSGEQRDGGQSSRNVESDGYHGNLGPWQGSPAVKDGGGGASRFFLTVREDSPQESVDFERRSALVQPAPSTPAAVMPEMPVSSPAGGAPQPRMFYTAKASADERITYERAEVVGGGRVAHPT